MVTDSSQVMLFLQNVNLENQFLFFCSFAFLFCCSLFLVPCSLFLVPCSLSLSLLLFLFLSRHAFGMLLGHFKHLLKLVGILHCWDMLGMVLGCVLKIVGIFGEWLGGYFLGFFGFCWGMGRTESLFTVICWVKNLE